MITRGQAGASPDTTTHELQIPALVGDAIPSDPLARPGGPLQAPVPMTAKKALDYPKEMSPAKD